MRAKSLIVRLEAASLQRTVVTVKVTKIKLNPVSAAERETWANSSNNVMDQLETLKPPTGLEIRRAQRRMATAHRDLGPGIGGGWILFYHIADNPTTNSRLELQSPRIEILRYAASSDRS